MKLVSIRILSGCILALSCVSGFAADPDAGKRKSAVCAGCHGPQGIAVAPNFPNLAGQNRTYLIAAIQAYQSGKRNDPIMKGMVAALSQADVEDLAAYFSALPMSRP
ncbi:MAG: cytochrome c [Pseudomonadota bacterium]|nr:cytochrome c [Pseudomonadota bacterium]